MITVEGVHKRYGDVHVLRGVSLEVQPREVAALIGGSGCGKSTLLRCLNALERFDAGAIHIGDLSLEPGEANNDRQEHERKLRCKVGMVFQHFNLFANMTVLENVMSGPVFALGVSREEAADRASKMLKRVGMDHKMDARPATLSGGQQQRVGIARALVNEPEVMLFDEPTSALDPRMTGEVLAVMSDLAASGQTMIVASHAMGFVRRSAHRVHVMSEGGIVESGTPEQIFEACKSEKTRELLAQAALC